MKVAHPLTLLALLAVFGCRGRDGVDKANPPADDSSPEQAPAADWAPWTRDEERAPGSVTFTELLYNHPTDEDLEWIELHNPMALDMDLSGWSLAGGVSFTFAEGTVLPAGGYQVVAADPALLDGDALGPYTGRLSNGGERVELLSNGGRRIDTVAYGDDEPWPVQADGSGHALAKLRATTASDRAESWSYSAQPGGTPGAPNQIDPAAPPTTVALLPMNATWRFDDSGAYPAADWASAHYDDSAWDEGEAELYAGAPAAFTDATVRVTADNYYGLYIGEADGTNLSLIAEDPDGDWTSVESYAVSFGPDDHLVIAAWEAPWDNGGPQMLIAELELGDGTILGAGTSTFEGALGPAQGCPGTSPPDPPPDEADIAALLASAAFAAPAVQTGPSSSPWGWALASSFDASTQYIWLDTFSDQSITNTDNTYALFRSVDPISGRAGETELAGPPTTALFRATFTLDADPAATELFARCSVDDGAVFYLNGVEVHRENMPAGAISASTLASSAVDEVEDVTIALSSAPLSRGLNTLAVEAHQAARDDADLLFGCALSARVRAAVATPTVALNELGPASESAVSVELLNLSAQTQQLGGLILRASSGEALTLDDATLEVGALSAFDAFPAADGEVVFLYAADGVTLLDAARVRAFARGREDGGGWRTVSEPTPGEANRVARSEDVILHEIQYHRAPRVSDAGYTDEPGEWIELFNRGESAVDLSGWSLNDAVAFSFPDGAVLEPGAYLVVSNDAAALRAEHPDIAVIGDFAGSLSDRGERILLLDANHNPADEVHYLDGGRWPRAADGGGSTLELRDIWADNAAGEAWAASDESARTAWESYEIRGSVDPSAVGPDGTWNELVLGLLDAGEVLIDDLSVVKNPDASAVEVLQSGAFDDMDAWRIIGNHRHSEIVPDPDDPSESVLRLVATGPTEHMHNHAETTLTRSVDEREVQIRFRARWVWGSNQLHTRLYFNRLPRTTLLPMPTLSGTPGAANSRGEENIGPTFEELGQDLPAPAAGDAVQIHVRVSDPDELAAVRLWSSVDGGAFTDQPMEEEGGRFVATLEGQAEGAIVQLYVEAEDALGAVATFPAAGPDSRALIRFGGDPAQNGLHNLRLIMTGADSDWLLDDPNLMSNDWLGATVVYDEGEVLYDVGVRAKGSERGRPEQLRLGYALRFNPEQLFRGQHRSALIDRSEGVNFGQREVLLNLAMARAGVVSAEHNDLVYALTPRAEHTGPAELQLDRSTGLMLDAQFDDGSAGMLFDYELIYYPTTTDDGTAEGQKLPQPDGVIGTTLTDLGADKEAYRWNFMLQNNPRQDDYTGLLQLCETFSYRGSDRFLEEVGEVIDVDQWLRGFAIASLAGAVDNYGGDSSQHNARFYQRPTDGLFLYFPHDLDFFGSAYAAVVGSSDLSALLQDPDHHRAYYRHLEDIISRAYNTDYLGPWCDQLGALLPAQDFDSHCQFIDDRADYVMSEVNSQYPAAQFAITTNGGADFATSDSAVVLDGEGWIDVWQVRLNGEALSVEWLDARSWRITAPLQEGDNALSLEAVDLGGEVVGSDDIRVRREE